MWFALLALVLIYAWDIHRRWRQEEKEVADLRNRAAIDSCMARLRSMESVKQYSYIYDGEPPVNWERDIKDVAKTVASMGMTTLEAADALKEALNAGKKEAGEKTKKEKT